MAGAQTSVAQAFCFEGTSRDQEVIVRGNQRGE